MADRNTVIIGGGLGGMVCAHYLLRFGHKVTVLEQNHQTGGAMSGFRRKGYTFDGGDQSFESLGIVFPILKELGFADDLQWSQCRYRMISQDFDFRLTSIDAVEQALCEAFPEEAAGFRSVFKEVRRVQRFLVSNYDPHSFPLLEDFRLKYLLRNTSWLPSLLKWLKFDYRRKVLSVIKDPVLRNWLTHIGYNKMPFIFFAGFWHLWSADYWYPVGGMQAFHKLLADRFKEAGGQLLTRSSVVSIRTEKGKAVAAVLGSGEEIPGDQFIYAGDYKALVETILGPGHFSAKCVESVRNAPLTESLLNVYLGVNIPKTEMENKLGGEHIFYFPNYEAIFPDETSPRDIHRKMWVALNYFGTDNPQSAPEGKSALVVQTYSSYEWENYWRNGSEAFPRKPEYLEFKDTVGRELVETAENVLPGLSSHIDYYEVGSPLSIQRFSRNSRGASGGWCYHDKVSFAYRNTALNLFKTPLPNLEATGHYALWPGGVISAALSGKLSAYRVSGRSTLDALRSGRNGS